MPERYEFDVVGSVEADIEIARINADIAGTLGEPVPVRENDKLRTNTGLSDERLIARFEDRQWRSLEEEHIPYAGPDATELGYQTTA